MWFKSFTIPLQIFIINCSAHRTRVALGRFHALFGEGSLAKTMAVLIISAILSLLAGIGVFLIATKFLSSNLESVSGNKLKALFSKTSKSKLLGVGIGTVATAAIQSSGAVSVMVIGFVNASLMTLPQAATIIFGANIGTTITGQIVALGTLGETISTTVIFSTFTFIGACMVMFSKKDIVRKSGGILLGFGLIFVALDMMSSAMAIFTEEESLGVQAFLAAISNPLLLVIIGAVLTAVIQSSSVMTGIAITMVFSGLISLDQGIYLTMGSNIGSCVVAVIAGIGSSTNAKRTALIHLIFNISGVILFMIAGVIMREASHGAVTFGSLFQKMFPNVPSTQLAMFHTFFNVITVIIILPFTNLLVKLVTKILPERKKKPDPDAPKLVYLEEHFLSTPPIAVAQMRKEVLNMAEIALYNFDCAANMLCTLDFADKDTFVRNEEELNFLNREIVRFNVKLSKADVNAADNVFLSTVYHTVSDLERIGDYAENIMEYAQKMQSSNDTFSQDAISEIKEIKSKIDALAESVMLEYSDNDLTLLGNIYNTEDAIDAYSEQITANHITRLDQGLCTPDSGVLFTSFVSDSERIADHFVNVAKSVRSFSKRSKDNTKSLIEA